MITILTMILAVLMIIAALLAGIIDAIYKLPVPDRIPYETLWRIETTLCSAHSELVKQTIALRDVNNPGVPANFR